MALLINFYIVYVVSLDNRNFATISEPSVGAGVISEGREPA